MQKSFVKISIHKWLEYWILFFFSKRITQVGILVFSAHWLRDSRDKCSVRDYFIGIGRTESL